MKKMILNKHYINYFDSHLCLYLSQDAKHKKRHHKRHLNIAFAKKRKICEFKCYDWEEVM